MCGGGTFAAERECSIEPVAHIGEVVMVSPFLNIRVVSCIIDFDVEHDL